MATVDANDTAYTATSSSSASSWQNNDSDMLTGNHLGIAEFLNSVKGISGVNNSYMTVTEATCYVYPRDDVNKTFTVCVATSHANKGSSHPTSNTSSGFTINASNNQKVSVDVTALMNNINFNTASIYVHFKSSWANGFRRKSIKCPQLKITAALTYTNVSSPGTPSVSVSGNTCTGSWGAASGGHNTTVASYTYVWNTSATGTTGTQTTTTSRSCSFSGTSGTTYYLHVMANSSPNNHNSGWVHSSAVTIGAHPSVVTGNIITKGQMDTLRSWKSNSPTAVSQGGIAYASTASTYRSASQGGIIYATWYNGA